MSETVTKEAKSGTRAVVVPPFGIAADHPRNSDLLLQCIPGIRLRSSIDGTRGVVDEKTGDIRVPQDQARHLASFPRTPGMQLIVNPAALTYEIIDPMHGDVALCSRVERYLRDQTGMRVDKHFDGYPPRTGTLDVHRMKTLVREMFNLVQAKEARPCKGVMPTMEDIEDLPGKFLLNPGSTIGSTQPKYEDDWDHWVENLSRTGG